MKAMYNSRKVGKTVNQQHTRIWQLLGRCHKTLAEATELANLLTKAHRQYWTALPNSAGTGWYATSQYNPILWR